METLARQSRNLYQAALIVFLVTIVIGILNGLDVWEPSPEMLITHVHAGTLGWITMAVIGVLLAMFRAGASDAEVTTGKPSGPNSGPGLLAPLSPRPRPCSSGSA